MALKIVTGYAGNMEKDNELCPYRHLFLQSFEPYCKKHGYELKTYWRTRNNDEVVNDRDESWRKFAIINKELNNCDWLLWVDTDIIVLNSDNKIENLYGEFDILTTKEDVIESGALLLKNSDYTKIFLKKWFKLDDKIDQKALENLLLSTDSKELNAHFKFLKNVDFMIKHVHIENRTKNTYFMHVPGSPVEDKLYYMTKYMI